MTNLQLNHILSATVRLQNIVHVSLYTLTERIVCNTRHIKAYALFQSNKFFYVNSNIMSKNIQESSK